MINPLTEQLTYTFEGLSLNPQETASLSKRIAELKKQEDTTLLTDGLARRLFKTQEGIFVCAKQTDGKPVGKGSFKHVLRAHSIEETPERVILKAHLDCPIKERLFDQEVQAWQMCAGSGIGLPLIAHAKSTTTAGKHKGYILTERAETDFFEILKSKSLDATTRFLAALQITKQVSSMHEKGMVHCDIKPENILRKNGKYYLTDFGFTRSISDPQEARGSIPYIAPELAYQLSGKRDRPPITNSYASDAWALGSVLLATYHPKGLPLAYVELLSIPRIKDQFRFIVNLQQDEITEYINTQLARTPPEIRDIIHGLLTIDPSKRMSAQEAYQRLQIIDASFA